MLSATSFWLQILLDFYFWFLAVIYIVRVYLVQSERSALLVAIKEDAAQGHASTSLYTETACLSNNLLGILTPKINIFGKNNNKQQLMRIQKTEFLFYICQYFDLQQISCYNCFHYLFFIVNDLLARFPKLVINHILFSFSFQLRIAYV